MICFNALKKENGVFMTLLLVLTLLMTACWPLPDQTDSPILEPGEWHRIFNGKDLDGWETLGDLETSVADGILHIHASHPNNNAWVLTNRIYRNFNLELEFLMQDTNTNSGVLIRFEPQRQGLPNISAYEANIDWRLNHQNVMGTLENAARSNYSGGAEPGMWHKMRIEANGDRLNVFFDDRLICQTHNRRALSGKIGLQVPINQGGDIAFRNIRLQQLPDTPTLEAELERVFRSSTKPLVALVNDAALSGWHTIGEGKWTFDGAVLHGYSGNSHSFLVTDEVYKNFYLRCLFKIKKEDNSGIFIRKHPDSTAVNTTNAIECNIYDHNGFGHAYSTGSIVGHARAFSNLIDYEDWNVMEIMAKDNRLLLAINGDKSAEIYLPQPFNRAGNICLQAGTKVFTDNGPSDIYFKDLVIRDLDQ